MKRSNVNVVFDMTHDVPKGLRVLLVDPDANSAEASENHLTRCNYSVTKCASVTAAKQLLRQSAFDALVVEEKLILNKCNGGKPELIKVAGTTPVILLGGSVDGDTITKESFQKVMKGIQMGAAEYLHKPLCYQAVWKIWQHCVRQRLKKARVDPANMLAHDGKAGYPSADLASLGVFADTENPEPARGKLEQRPGGVAAGMMPAAAMGRAVMPKPAGGFGADKLTTAAGLVELDDPLDQAAAAVAAATVNNSDAVLAFEGVQQQSQASFQVPLTIAQREQIGVQNQAMLAVSRAVDEPEAVNEAGPIGLKLRKSPSLVNIISNKLTPVS